MRRTAVLHRKSSTNLDGTDSALALLAPSSRGAMVMGSGQQGERHPSSATTPGRRTSQPPKWHPGSWEEICGEEGKGTSTKPATNTRTKPHDGWSWSCSVLLPGNHGQSLICGGVVGAGPAAGSDGLEGIKGLEEGRARGDGSLLSSCHPPPAASVIVTMASLIKPFVACALFLFALVHAGVVTPGIHHSGLQLRPRSSPVVTVKNGSYEGIYSSAYDQDYFLGMRYAQVCH